MADEKLFESQGDYEVLLLRLLYKMPDGQGKVSVVCELFEAEYGHRIPEEHRQRRTGWSLEPFWKNSLRRSRQDLKGRGFLDAPRKGIWRITDAGRRWVEENPSVARIKGVRIRRSQGTRGGSSRSASVPGLTLEMLEQTRKAMPADQFRAVWGALHDQLLAEERAKAISIISQRELGRRTRQRLDEIHAFLQGETSSTPSAEVLCDWIHFCYALELYREAATLLPYAREDEVDPVTYKRTKRVASLCRNKLTR